MTPTYYLRDMIIGDIVPVSYYHYDGTTFAWVEGWNASMDGDISTNPYNPGTTEGHDWQDGYDAAERD